LLGRAELRKSFFMENKENQIRRVIQILAVMISFTVPTLAQETAKLRS